MNLKWILIEEGLPKKPVPVLVTVKWDFGLSTVKVAEYGGELFGWRSSHECDGNVGGKVIAWMPMPTAYEEGKQGE